jgi:hypothetical protein
MVYGIGVRRKVSPLILIHLLLVCASTFAIQSPATVQSVAVARPPAATPDAAVTHAPPAFDLERMATCEDSWLDWRDDPARTKAFAEGLKVSFEQRGKGPSLAPRGRTTFLRMPVLKVFPDTIGMARGFSILLYAMFDDAKALLEQGYSTHLDNCQTSAGTRMCSREIGENKTLLVMGDTGANRHQTLLGCFYNNDK